MPKGTATAFLATFTMTVTREIMAMSDDTARQKANFLIDNLTPGEILERGIDIDVKLTSLRGTNVKGDPKLHGTRDVGYPHHVYDTPTAPRLKGTPDFARQILDGDKSQAYERELERAHAQDVDGAHHSLRDRDWR
jgi:hypothetical protein